MPGPFPGVDPYIEDQVSWGDFHARLITYLGDQLSDRMPDAYVARIEEYIHLVQPGDERLTRPDAVVLRKPGMVSGGRRRGGGVATVEPVEVPLADGPEVEVRDSWVEVRRLPDLELVSVIEVLSPRNKHGDGRVEYLDKRARLLERPVHLVEIDLLLGGHRVPMGHGMPPGDAFAIVSRADRRPVSHVYAWTLHDPLPPVPVPLRSPDPDVVLDMASSYATAYDRGRYARLLDYRKPLTLPIDPDTRSWAEGFGRAMPS